MRRPREASSPKGAPPQGAGRQEAAPYLNANDRNTTFFIKMQIALQSLTPPECQGREQEAKLRPARASTEERGAGWAGAGRACALSRPGRRGRRPPVPPGTSWSCEVPPGLPGGGCASPGSPEPSAGRGSGACLLSPPGGQDLAPHWSWPEQSRAQASGRGHPAGGPVRGGSCPLGTPDAGLSSPSPRRSFPAPSPSHRPAPLACPPRIKLEPGPYSPASEASGEPRRRAPRSSICWLLT